MRRDAARTLAAGLLHHGLDADKLTPLGRAELRAAIEKLLDLANVGLTDSERLAITCEPAFTVPLNGRVTTRKLRCNGERYGVRMARAHGRDDRVVCIHDRVIGGAQQLFLELGVTLERYVPIEMVGPVGWSTSGAAPLNALPRSISSAVRTRPAPVIVAAPPSSRIAATLPA